jgi:hypothetical protein
MWHSIARTLSVDRHLDAWSQARLLALLNITLADGYIAVLAGKYDPTPLQPAAPQPASLRHPSDVKRQVVGVSRWCPSALLAARVASLVRVREVADPKCWRAGVSRPRWIEVTPRLALPGPR